MQVWRSLDEVPDGIGPTVVVIGNFDGVHRGHQSVIGRAREIADRDGHALVAVTFDPHPMAVLRPEHAPSALTTLDARVALLADVGVDHVFALPVLPRDRGLVTGGVRRPGAGRRAPRSGRRRRRQLPLREPGLG